VGVELGEATAHGEGVVVLDLGEARQGEPPPARPGTGEDIAAGTRPESNRDTGVARAPLDPDRRGKRLGQLARGGDADLGGGDLDGAAATAQQNRRRPFRVQQHFAQAAAIEGRLPHFAQRFDPLEVEFLALALSLDDRDRAGASRSSSARSNSSSSRCPTWAPQPAAPGQCRAIGFASNGPRGRES